MATLTQRVETVETRTDRLESIFAAFMARTDATLERLDHTIERMEREGARHRAETNRTIERLDRTVERMEREGARDRAESAKFREDMRAESAKFREDMRAESAKFREDMRAESAGFLEQFRAEAAEERAESARFRKELNKRWGDLANKMGTIVEDIVAPSIRRLAQEVFDCGEQQIFLTRASVTRSDDRSRKREFDALYVGTRAVLLNETKATPSREYVQTFARFVDSGEFARYFPQYRELPILPAFSSLSIGNDLIAEMTRRGIYAIAMGDEVMQVLNRDQVLDHDQVRDRD